MESHLIFSTVTNYSVEVHTGKRQYAGTDANVYVNIFGEMGDTGNRNLRKSKNNINKFEKGKVWFPWQLFISLTYPKYNG